MNVGLDYWNTISHNLETFRDLAFALHQAGHHVYVITAVGQRRKDTVEHDIRALAFPCTGIRVVVFTHPREAPALKHAVCRELGISLFFDDRVDTCAYLNDRGIVACHVLRHRM